MSDLNKIIGIIREECGKERELRLSDRIVSRIEVLDLTSAGEKDYTAEDALRRAREIALQSEAATLCMGEIIKVADMALGEKTPLPEWMTSPHPTRADNLGVVESRDIWECANQLHGYIDTSTPDNLASFLRREGDAAADLARIITEQAERIAELEAEVRHHKTSHQVATARTVELLKEHDEFRLRTEAAEADRDRMKEALRPFSNAVFNDNGDVTFNYTAFNDDDLFRAYTLLKGALNGGAEK